MPSMKELLEQQKKIRENMKDDPRGAATKKTQAGKRKAVRKSVEPSVHGSFEPPETDET